MKHDRKNKPDHKTDRDKKRYRHASYVDKNFVHTPHQKKMARIKRLMKRAICIDDQ